jgi:prepilin-type N-terminal cleavage/methylation domain-containing protein
MKTRRAGFTLVELLVVIAILAILAGIVAVGLIPMKKKAYVEKSRAFIQKVQTALDGYQNEFRDLPPDGFDNESPAANRGWVYDQATPKSGVKLGNAYYKNSAVLVYFLCHPITNVTFIGSDLGQFDARQRREKPLPPFLVDTPIEALSMGYHDDAFDLGKNPGSSAWNDAWNVCELVDAWGRPIDYDKIAIPSFASYKQTYDTGTDVFLDGAKCHPDQDYLTIMLGNLTLGSDDERCCPLVDHPHDIADSTGTIDKGWHKDPRAPGIPAGDGCLDYSKAATPRNAGGCDLWSHGSSWTNPRNALANWK